MKRVLFAAFAVMGLATAGWSATPAELVARIQTVGTEGANHAAAIAAAKELSKAPPSALPEILKSFDAASPLAANWLCGTFETIADRALKQKQLDGHLLEAFVIDRNNNASARRLAYEWLLKVDNTAADRLIPGMLQDANPEFRRDAVARLIDAGTKQLDADKKDDATATLKEAMIGAVDDDQVRAIVKPLRDLGEKIDIQKHFGFVTAWKLIGPFDNTGTKWFDVAYPPEKEIKLDAKYPGKGEEEVAWKEFATDDEYGTVNLAKALAPHKGAITYATAEFQSPAAQSVEIRLGTPNAWKLWVNGQLAFARDEYHRGTQLDQYKVPVKLQAGRNVLLLKVCQNEQTEEWAQDWKYQLRVCTKAGSAVLPTDVKTSQRETGAVRVAKEGR
jgi:hypothetical protein